jgi:hypothetical protein
MIIPDAHPARRTPRSAHAQSSRKRTFILIAVLPLTAAFALAGTPIATAAPVLMNNHMTSVSDFVSAPCPGKPGICPDPA